MRHYEVVFMVHPDQSDQVPAMTQRYQSTIETNGGTVHRLEDWGRRQLAYPINKIHKGTNTSKGLTPMPKLAPKPTVLLILCLALTSCSSTHHSRYSIHQDGPPKRKISASATQNATPHNEAKSRYGNPHTYHVCGHTYHVLDSANGYDRTGIASWYGRKFHGHLTSSREPYNMYAMTAANKVLPIPCYVRVTNLENNRTCIVKVNDRGPFRSKRIIDLSYAAAKKLGYAEKGTAHVRVTALPMHRPKESRQGHQIAAFHNHQNALQYRNTTANRTHHPTWIETTQSQKGPLYRIYQS